MEICHPWHYHPLFLSEEAKFLDRCSICRKGLDGNPFYACVGCKYYLHKSCSQLPLKIQHHFHQHPIELYFIDRFGCNSCHKTFKDELSFKCFKCDFDLDVKCALMSDIDAEGKEFIRHFTHPHPLTICSKDGDNPLTCFACKKTSSNSIYGCTHCDYFLHKSCSEISATHVLNANHPQHALRFVIKFGCCYCCGKLDYTWRYFCSLCNFDWDVSCLIETTNNAQNSKRSCFLCQKQRLDSDSCIHSLYFINQSCIQLPEEIECDFHSHKLLSLLSPQDFVCDSCHKWYNKQSHYGCEECNFRLDIKCALVPGFQHEESDESIWPVIPHHFSHQHPLQLIREVYDINCSACCTTKPSPIYGCIKCQYFLHQSCIELPSQIKHPLHDSHVLTLQPLRDYSCKFCCRKYNGFAFGCIQCVFFIGMECLLFELSSTLTVVHKYHDHPLCLIEKSYSERCHSDNAFCQLSKESSEFKLTESYLLRCIECDYDLHILCGPLPFTIKHKSHLHVLKLVDSIVEDDPDEQYCDVCEELRTPRLCIYYCEDCSFFAHVHCVMSEIKNAFKAGPQKVEFRIVGDLRLEDNINPSYNNLNEQILLDVLNSLDAADKYRLAINFPAANLFLGEEAQDPWGLPEVKYIDYAGNIIDELSIYNDDIFLNIGKRLSLFHPGKKYHILPNECRLPVIEIQGYKVTSNFADLFRALSRKYRDFELPSGLTENVKSIALYFLCRIVSDMRRTYVDQVNERQLFTWHFYKRCIRNLGFPIQLIEPFLDRITRTYFGLRGMRFENEAAGRLDCETEEIEKKILELKTRREELELCGRQIRPGKIAEESKVVKELFIVAKQEKHNRAGDGIV